MRKLICIFWVLLCAMLVGCQSAPSIANVSYANVEQINAEALQAFDSGDYSGDRKSVV